PAAVGERPLALDAGDVEPDLLLAALLPDPAAFRLRLANLAGVNGLGRIDPAPALIRVVAAAAGRVDGCAVRLGEFTEGHPAGARHAQELAVLPLELAELLVGRRVSLEGDLGAFVLLAEPVERRRGIGGHAEAQPPHAREAFGTHQRAQDVIVGTRRGKAPGQHAVAELDLAQARGLLRRRVDLAVVVVALTLDAPGVLLLGELPRDVVRVGGRAGPPGVPRHGPGLRVGWVLRGDIRPWLVAPKVRRGAVWPGERDVLVAIVEAAAVLVVVDLLDGVEGLEAREAVAAVRRFGGRGLEQARGVLRGLCGAARDV